jgi:hypothetical protein
MTFPSTGGHDPETAAGAVDDEAGGLESIPPSGHAGDGPGVNYGIPDRYVGPEVPDQAALVNPSAGFSSPPGGGVNPQGGPSPSPGSVPAERYDQAPGNTSKGNPSY